MYIHIQTLGYGALIERNWPKVIFQIVFLYTVLLVYTSWENCAIKRFRCGDFPGGAVVKNPHASAGDIGLIPGPGRFPHATEQLSLCTTTSEPAL